MASGGKGAGTGDGAGGERGIGGRKDDHLDLCATDAVGFRGRGTLLDCVELIHQSLPDLALDEVDPSVELCGKRLRAPIVIAAMTGGTERAAEVNQTLAALAETRGYAIGLGSQRAMDKAPDTAWTYEVRQHAPTALLFGNIGVVQAREMSTAKVAALVSAIGADALCVHMNPAMELVQPGGDRDFRDGTKTFARLVAELDVPVIAKETGSGISAQTASKLRDAGVGIVDVSGAGGTSWVGVETLRAEGDARALGELLWDWGVPTAASVVNVRTAGMRAIATGGLRTGLDVARAIALGASAGGIARGILQAFFAGGRDGANRFLEAVESELRAVMLLTCSRRLTDLQIAPRIILPPLRDWLA